MVAFRIGYTDLGRLRAGLAPTGAARTCPSLTRRAAASGSVSPMPKDGHWPATGQAPQAGVREWQVRRPWMITRCENIVHSRFSIMAHSSASTATGSSLSVRPSRLVTRSTCVPGLPVDTHVLRVPKRLGLTESDDPVAVEAELCAMIEKREWTMFSHRVIIHGRRTCHARTPACGAWPAVSY